MASYLESGLKSAEKENKRSMQCSCSVEAAYPICTLVMLIKFLCNLFLFIILRYSCGSITVFSTFYRIVDILLKAIMRMMWLAGGFHWINVKGRRALPAEAAILTVAPHSSYFDAIPVTMTFASIVMKAESKDIPIWGSK